MVAWVPAMGGNSTWHHALPVDPEEVTPQPQTQARELVAQQMMSLTGELWTRRESQILGVVTTSHAWSPTKGANVSRTG